MQLKRKAKQAKLNTFTPQSSSDDVEPLTENMVECRNVDNPESDCDNTAQPSTTATLLACVNEVDQVSYTKLEKRLQITDIRYKPQNTALHADIQEDRKTPSDELKAIDNVGFDTEFEPTIPKRGEEIKILVHQPTSENLSTCKPGLTIRDILDTRSIDEVEGKNKEMSECTDMQIKQIMVPKPQKGTFLETDRKPVSLQRKMKQKDSNGGECGLEKGKLGKENLGFTPEVAMTRSSSRKIGADQCRWYRLKKMTLTQKVTSVLNAILHYRGFLINKRMLLLVLEDRIVALPMSNYRLQETLTSVCACLHRLCHVCVCDMCTCA